LPASSLECGTPSCFRIKRETPQWPKRIREERQLSLGRALKWWQFQRKITPSETPTTTAAAAVTLFQIGDQFFDKAVPFLLNPGSMTRHILA
jgi:hypothetical protein